ncbi:MAG: phosphate transport system regulatory protein PhoU [Rickettsiales bacterium]|nr:phosphate transport system regulatory protein PhoU [Rickettsiales bacterium]OUV54759.1 MAG: phosphate transport system regulatory protein PhoU [Rickettsiales bacterium TMED127]|tara:strand:- start:27200 stop:27859 length:660 start_codon:yes stop_codon:yes gene_type:complete
MEKHIVTTYDNDLESLKNNLLEMCVLVEKQLFMSVEILKISNEEKIKKILATENQVNKLELKIREMATNTLSKRQPLADDLRQIIISIKISSIIERIGDHSANIAKRVSQADITPRDYTTDSIFRLGQSVRNIVSLAVNAYSSENEELASSIPVEDKQIDLLYETCFREHIVLMMESYKTIGYLTQMIFISKELERIGDLTKSISKEVLYSLKGKLMKY